MADRKISELSNITGVNLNDADEFVVVDTSADETKALTFGELKAGLDTGSGFVRITGDTMTGNLSFGDNDKAIFGAGSDLQIYHDGSNSYIDDASAGSLFVRGNPAVVLGKYTGERFLDGTADGAVQVYYDNAVKLATTSTGISVTGNATFADNGKAIFGAGSDLQIYHDGAHSRISDEGTGNLILKGSSAIVFSAVTNGEHGRVTDGGGWALGYSGSTKLATTSTGVDVTGTAVTDGLTVAGNVSVDGGTIKLDGNYPVGTENVALGDTALDSVEASGVWNVAIGAKALTALTTGDSNTGVGRIALETNTTGSNNTGLGYAALQSNTTANNNTAVGYLALTENTTGVHNIAIGATTMQNTTTGLNNTAVGGAALISNTTGGYNTALGRQALYLSTTAGNNTAVGYQAGYSNTTGAQNTVIGSLALYTATTGSRNTALGYNAGNDITTASDATVIGSNAGETATTSQQLTAVGAYAGRYTTTGSFNAFMGYAAGEANTTGQENVYVGRLAAQNNTTGSKNTAVGNAALKGGGSATFGNNVGVGHAAGHNLTTGASNVFVGAEAGYNNTTGATNVAIGQTALQSNTTSSNNIAIGADALEDNTTGSSQIAIGRFALGNNTTGTFNVAVGHNALINQTTANSNVAVGYLAMQDNTTAGTNVAIGREALADNTTASNNTAVGYNAGRKTLTGDSNTFIGENAGSNTVGNRNTFVGRHAGLNSNLAATQQNTFVGTFSGRYVTSGAKNTIVGAYDGNQGGLDIRTSSNNIVLSDGDGNPRVHVNSSGTMLLKNTGEAGPHMYRSGNAGNDLRFYSTNGSFGSETAKTSGSNVGQIHFHGHDGTDYRLRSSIQVLVDGSVSTNTVPMRMTFHAGTTSNTERMRLHSTGELSMSGQTGGDQYKNGTLTVRAVGNDNTGWENSGITTHGSYGGGISLVDATPPTTSSKGYTIFLADNGNDFYIKHNGSSTASSGGVYLNNAATSWSSASDERDKENLVNITGAVDNLKTLRTVKGNYIESPNDTKAFLIAQDVNAFLPEAVSIRNKFDDEADQRYGLDYQQLIPVLVAAIKEQQSTIDDLETRLAALENA